jgi:predicted nucleotidyltransferase
MRLQKSEIENLKKSTYQYDNQAKIYLFGSRVDDNKRGGDIDLLIISKKIMRQEVRMIKFSFYDEFGEQQLDILLDDGTLNDPFKKMIFTKSVKL